MIAATNPPSISAAAHAITRNTNSIDREANGKQPVSAFGNAIIAAHEDMAAIQAQKLAAGKSKLSVNTTHRLEAISHHYVPYVQTRNAKYVLRTTVNGVPVIPPGMHGKQLEQFVDHKSMAIQQAHAKTLVFISMAMPKHILKKCLLLPGKLKNCGQVPCLFCEAGRPLQQDYHCCSIRWYTCLSARETNPTSK